MILGKIYKVVDDKEDINFKAQYFISESLAEAKYRIYAGYLENKVAPAYNLPGFVFSVVWTDEISSCDHADNLKIKDIVADVIDEVDKDKPDQFQVKGKMY